MAEISITKSAKTCRCFLKLQQYVDWLDLGKLSNHGGLLWIKGKPGAGKSTLMKFAFSDALRKSKRKGAIVISFFFNARGEELERSTAGLYRSLLVQLFEALPDLQHVLDTVRVGHQWSVESLKSLLEDTVKAMGNTSVVCFIDALDECDEKQIRDMLSFIRSTSDQAATAGTRLHVCFASRHYPHITIGKGLDLVIEGREEHQHSIANYLDTELHIGHDQFAEQIRSNLQEKASGVFMWVVLVVDILNKEYDRGCKHGLKKRLKSIPSDLHELFQNILSRDTSNTRGLLLCIQWVLFARRPLKPEELYFAIMSGVEPESLPDCHSKGHITDDVMRRYILDNSKGLAESTNSNIPTIQFIHESVRDFLLKDNGLRRIWPNLESNLEGQSHENLRQCCLTYMTNKIVVNHDLSSLPPGAPQSQAKDRRQAIAQRFPFLEYANQNLLYHADKAEGNGVSQKDFISKFPLCDWIVWSNLFEKHQIRRYTKTASLLYILAERNMPNLIRILDSAQSCFTVEDDRYGTPIFAALATQSNEAIHTLIDMQASSKTRGFAIQDLHERFSDRKGDTSPYNRTFTFSRRNAILEHIIEKEDEATLAFYLSTKEDSMGYTALSLAVTYGSEILIRSLLDRGADIKACNYSGRTPLHQAALLGHEDIVRLLLNHGANIEAVDRAGNTPLVLARENKRELVVKLLLNHGASGQTRD
ncbi:hypothetical protein F4677DRAFT_455428 [Hypoxylon crocopeplum]|nr:hypothetical protein F4677DRAFT_455428 [Hypoxylon crocopeplum]